MPAASEPAVPSSLLPPAAARFGLTVIGIRPAGTGGRRPGVRAVNCCRGCADGSDAAFGHPLVFPVGIRLLAWGRTIRRFRPIRAFASPSGRTSRL